MCDEAREVRRERRVVEMDNNRMETSMVSVVSAVPKLYSAATIVSEVE